ncbi:MAG: hypothetical protein V2A58_05820 [Planctomycetota bacterium]
MIATLKANLAAVSRESVDPAKWSKKENPITREDLGEDFKAGVPIVTDPKDPRTNRLYLDHGRLGDVVYPPAEMIQTPQSGNAVADFSANDEGVGVCREAVLDLVRRGAYMLSVWNFFPYAGTSDMPDVFVPAATHEWLLETAGRLFGGYNVGEQEGRYLGQFAKTARPKRDDESDYDYYCEQLGVLKELEKSFQKHLTTGRFKDRKEAYRDFRRWMRVFEDGMHQYLTPVVHTNWAHYHCELEGARMVLAELSLILINHQVAFAFLRGAARQYGLLMGALISAWTRWGFSAVPDEKEGRGEARPIEVGPEKGTTTEIARRMWYLGYMCGLSTVAAECFFTGRETDYVSGKTADPPALSALGELQVTAADWCKRHPGRGVQYNPVAIMLDFYNGWLAPKHGYQYPGERRMTWNVFPYGRGDHQIDNFFRWVFPGYEEGSYHRDGTGTFVPTPFGDIFDVILSNADRKVLARYNAIVMLGQDGDVTPALKDYVREGGDLVVGCNDIVGHDGPFFGVRVTGRRLRSTKSRRGEREFREAPYTYREVETIGAEAFLESGEGHPLVTVNEYGYGRVIVVAADFWMSDLGEAEERKVGPGSQNVADRSPERTFSNFTEFADERNWDCPYNWPIKNRILAGATLATMEKEVCVHCRVPCTNDVSKQCDILEGIRDVLGEYLASFMPFTVDGPPVHYLVNLTDKKDMLILTLANHTDDEWRGSVAFKDRDIKVARATEWMTDAPGDLGNITISPKDMAIFEIKTNRRIL